MPDGVDGSIGKAFDIRTPIRLRTDAGDLHPFFEYLFEFLSFSLHFEILPYSRYHRFIMWRKRTEEFFRGLQDRICQGLEQLDGTSFREDLWSRDGGGGGR